MRWLLTVLRGVTIAAALLLVDQVSSAVPPGFQEETVLDIQNGQGTAFDLTTDHGTLFLAYKEGKVYVYPFQEGTPGSRVLALDIVRHVCTNGDRGIQSVTAHPNFVDNGFVYLYYTYKAGASCGTYESSSNPVDRLSRFRLNRSNQLVEETVFLETKTYLKTRDGGGTIFGNDGKLWCTIGDHGFNTAAQSTTNLHGTLIRLNDDGSIPRDNPYANNPRCNEDGDSPTNEDCPEIWANGLRNPFSVNKNMNKQDVTEFMINDVGASDWESCYVAGTNYEESNYGWRTREGPCKIHTRRECDNNPANFDLPYHFYEHSNEGFGAMVAGTYIPDGWHSDYDGCYFYSDLVFDKIYIMCEGGNPCLACNPPRSGKKVDVFSEYSSVVAMKFLPYQGRQALYYLSIYDGKFRRVWKTGNENAKPIAHISFLQTGLLVEFDGGGSYDSDGSVISYQWDFGDGSGTASGEKVDHEYSVPGVYEVLLTVKDNEGREDTESGILQVGKGPEPYIQLPRKNDKFEVGQSFTLMGYAIQENGEEIASANLKWDVLRWHGNLHTHDFVTVYGNEVTVYDAPAPEDPYSVRTSYLEIRLTATDSHGLSSTISQEFWPVLADMNFTTDPPGLELLLMDDEFPFDSPAITLTTWRGHNLFVEAPEYQMRGDYEYEFESWSNGGAREHIVYVDGENIPLEAKYKVREIPRTHVLMDRGVRLEKGETKVSDTLGYSMTLEDDCTVAIRKESHTAVLARLGTAVSGDTCYTKLQGDCNFLIKSGNQGTSFSTKTSQSDNAGCVVAVFPGESAMFIGLFFVSVDTESHPSWMVELEDIPSTSAPTKLPTFLPSSAPTKLPTLTPTSAPTKLPTLTPTSAPTKLPTLTPTSAPTKLPTLTPTSAPTTLPTLTPTSAPTTLPTLTPATSPPTILPTRSPSDCTLSKYDEPCAEDSDCCSSNCYDEKCRFQLFKGAKPQNNQKIFDRFDNHPWDNDPWGNLRRRRKLQKEQSK